MPPLKWGHPAMPSSSCKHEGLRVICARQITTLPKHPLKSRAWELEKLKPRNTHLCTPPTSIVQKRQESSIWRILHTSTWKRLYNIGLRDFYTVPNLQSQQSSYVSQLQRPEVTNFPHLFPSPLTCHAIILLTGGILPNNLKSQYCRSIVFVVPKVATKPMIRFVRRMTFTALLYRASP